MKKTITLIERFLSDLISIYAAIIAISMYLNINNHPETPLSGYGTAITVWVAVGWLWLIFDIWKRALYKSE